MKKILYFLMVPIFLFSCEEDSAEPVTLTDNSDVELISDNQRFNSIKNQRDSDDFDIRGAERDGNIIRILVQYGGGCEEHRFEVLWNMDYDNLSGTEQGFNLTELLIVHDGNGDLCEAAITDTLTIDLNDIDETVDWSRYAVRLLNGSKDQSVVTFPMMESFMESEHCILEVEMERVVCGDGLLGNLWFRYAENNYLQPSSIASLILLDPDLPEGKYLMGVKVSTWTPEPDNANCLAFPGYSVPVEIWCIEKIE